MKYGVIISDDPYARQHRTAMAASCMRKDRIGFNLPAGRCTLIGYDATGATNTAFRHATAPASPRLCAAFVAIMRTYAPCLRLGGGDYLP